MRPAGQPGQGRARRVALLPTDAQRRHNSTTGCGLSWEAPVPGAEKQLQVGVEVEVLVQQGWRPATSSHPCATIAAREQVRFRRVGRARPGFPRTRGATQRASPRARVRRPHTALGFTGWRVDAARSGADDCQHGWRVAPESHGRHGGSRGPRAASKRAICTNGDGLRAHGVASIIMASARPTTSGRLVGDAQTRLNFASRKQQVCRSRTSQWLNQRRQACSSCLQRPP